MKMIIPAALIAVALSVPALAMPHEGGHKLMTSLSGAVEVPGPGDAKAAGMFKATVNPGQTKVCYTLLVTKLTAPTMAHIHRGAAGVAGPVVVALKAPVGGKSSACAMVTRELAKELIANPDGFYVNVHNAAFPAGAVRGQLMK